MHIVWLLFQFITVLLSFGMLVRILKMKPSKGQDYLMMAVVCTLVYCLGHVLEILSNTIYEAMYAVIIECMGQVWLCLFFIMFIYKYCDIKIPKKWFYFCVILNIVDVAYENVVSTMVEVNMITKEQKP